MTTKQIHRIAYFGGTFDPVHVGHLEIGRTLTEKFRLDQFFFLPAFHAPHKPDRTPTSEFHRIAMLSLSTQTDEKLFVSALEVEKRQKRYTIDTIDELKRIHKHDNLFFVMGADSWTDIRTWREWENVLLACNHIVVTRPGYEIKSDHVTDAVRERIIDLRGRNLDSLESDRTQILFSDAVQADISASSLRADLADGILDRQTGLPTEVANYIEKYDLYR